MTRTISEMEERLQHLEQILNQQRSDYYFIKAVECVTEVIDPGLAWVVIGHHGPTLVSKNLAIWDCDFSPEQKPSDNKVLLTASERLARFDRLYRFRLYRTYGGARVICTSHQHSPQDNLPEPDWFALVGQLLSADDRYMSISRVQEASRARLKPKSQKARGHELELTPNGRFATAPYLETSQFRACRFIGDVGTAEPLESLAKQIEHHDQATEALTGSKELY